MGTMEPFPYTTVPGRIHDLFKKITDIGIPKEVNRKWLETIGFKSKNDRSLLPLLKFIGFVDTSDCPTERWKRYRTRGGPALADGIRTGYSKLYATYPAAHNCSKKELEQFFSAHSSAGKQVIEKKVSTFQKLCELADFRATEPQVKDIVEEEGVDETPSTASMEVANKPYKEFEFAININVQLTLPETTDGKVYDAFFSAMKKHLLQGGL